MNLIVGLGNPGNEYDMTRHNVGFRVMRAFHTLHIEDFGSWKTKGNAQIAEGRIGGQKVVLAMPQTFMNRSGEAVAPLASFWDMAPESTVLVYDDLDLPVGTLRIRQGGGSGGHNGVRSVMERLGTGDFPRIRLGVAGKDRDTIPADAYVLQRFPSDEEAGMEDVIRKAIDALDTMLEKGVEAAMNTFNGSTEEA